MHARRKLAQWMRWRGFNQCRLASEISIDQGAVSRWLAGKAVPRWRFMTKIQELTNGFVAVGDWALPDPADGWPVELTAAPPRVDA